jgi:hypothetical protein
MFNNGLLMTRQPIFTGLIFDEFDHPVEVTYVGGEPCYVVNDTGFKRHIPSEQVDRQVFDAMFKMIEGHEEIVTEQTAKMLGQEDIFSKAIILEQLKNAEKQFDSLTQTGIPEEVRAYLGMMGLRIRINIHGEIIEIIQPGMTDPNLE